MTRIRATCPDCGEIDLRPADIELHILRSIEGEVGDGSTYRFSCPACAEAVVKPADERIARLLATGGVTVSVDEFGHDLDDKLLHLVDTTHPELPPGGPRFTADDVLTFHQQLQGDDWFERLREAMRT